MDKKTILSHITEQDIFERFFGSYVEGKLYRSPLRSGDKNPSFNIFRGRNGLRFKDLGGGGQYGDCFSFVALKENIPFNEACNFVAIQFGLSEDKEINTVTIKYNNEIFYNPFVIRKKFTWEEKPFPEFGEQIDFWERIGITKEFLDYFNVKNIKWFAFLNKDGKEIKINTKPFYPIYLYHYGDDVVRFYCPKAKKENKEIKFVGNTRDFDIFGIEQLKQKVKKSGRKEPIIGILAGQKDCMALYANTGIFSVCTASESTNLPEEQFEELQELADFIFVMYDPDEAGRKYSQKLHEEYLLPVVDVFPLFSKFSNTKIKIKDPADYYKFILENNIKDQLKLLIYETVYG